MSPNLLLQISPILASLRKHYVPALLIVLEIALACAVLCNAVSMIGQKLQRIQLPNGIDEAGLVVVTVDGDKAAASSGSIQRNIAALRNVPGVSAAAALNEVPLDGSAQLGSFATTVDGHSTVNTSKYYLGIGAAHALGLQLLKGRFFRDSDYAAAGLAHGLPTSHVVLITRSDAQRRWPGQSALGKVVYSHGSNWTVVGVVANVLAQDPAFGGGAGTYSSMFFPVQPSPALNKYVVQSAPGDRDRIARDAQSALSRLNPEAVITAQRYSAIRSGYFASMRSTTGLLVLVCFVMLFVTIAGIMGLSSFWVQQRRRQVGIRRAVGATRQDIIGYFMLENFLLSAMGIAAGVIAAVGLNYYLLEHFEIHRMPWYFLPLGAVILWLAGQFAALGPALKAATVPPGEAIRS